MADCQEKKLGMEHQYFEICIGKGPNESDNDSWMCIRGVKAPSIQEAEQFLTADVAIYDGHVLGVYPIDRVTAKSCYDFSNEEKWPMFGL